MSGLTLAQLPCQEQEFRIDPRLGGGSQAISGPDESAFWNTSKYNNDEPLPRDSLTHTRNRSACTTVTARNIATYGTAADTNGSLLPQKRSGTSLHS